MFLFWFSTNFTKSDCLPVYEMGCDGGTIPRRDELVRIKKKPEQVFYNLLFSYASKLTVSFL